MRVIGEFPDAGTRCDRFRGPLTALSFASRPTTSLKMTALRTILFMQRPAGVTAIAVLFCLVAGYLFGLGAIMLGRPGVVSMALGAPLLNGLEVAGPYMFLLMGSLGALIGWGLLRLHNWARRAAIAVGFVGIVMVVPSVSAATVEFRWPLIRGALGIIVRTTVVWYLWQTQVAEQFSKSARTA